MAKKNDKVKDNHSRQKQWDAEAEGMKPITGKEKAKIEKAFQEAFRKDPSLNVRRSK